MVAQALRQTTALDFVTVHVMSCSILRILLYLTYSTKYLDMYCTERKVAAGVCPKQMSFTELGSLISVRPS